MKKRILSVFLSLSMLLSVVVMPTIAEATADSIIKNIKLTRTSVNNYKIDFEFASSVNAESGTAYAFAIFTQNFVDVQLENGAQDFVNTDDYKPNIQDTVDTVDRTGATGAIFVKQQLTNSTVTEFTFTTESSIYSTGGTTLYILYNAPTADTNQVYQTVQLNADGSVVVDQTPINLELDGGTLENATTTMDSGTYTAAQLNTAFGTPTKEGFKFGGWSESNGGSEISGNITLEKNTAQTFYALWTEKTDFPTDKITINPTSVNFTGDAQKPTLVIDSTLTDAGITAADITLKYDGAESADGKTNADTYAITASVKETANYKKTAADLDLGNWTINTVNYTVGAVSSTIPIGTAIENYTFAGSVKNVKNEDVQGTFKITSSDKGNAVAGQEYTNLSWTFTPTTADANYNALTGTNGKLTGATKTDKAVTLSIPDNVTYDGQPHAATATVGDLASSAYEIQYKKTTEADSAYTATAPTNAGTYNVRVVFTGNNGDLYNMTGTTTGTLTINKKTVKINAINNLTKEYDGTTAAKKDGNDLTMADLTLDTTGVNLAADGAFAAVYDDANVNDATKVTISGVKLSDTDNYELDTTSLEMPASITAKPLTAALKAAANKSSKVYGSALTLGIDDFSYQYNNADITVSETELAGLAFTSDALAAGTAVGEHAITITTQPTSGNYNVTTASKITVTPLPVIITVTAVTPNKKYKGTAFSDTDLVTVEVTDGTNPVTGAALKYDYTKDSQPAATVTDAGTYSLAVTLDPSATNYTYKTTAPGAVNVTVDKADYTAPAKVEGTIGVGTDIENFAIDGEVTGVNGSVEGKFVITNTDKGKAVADQVYDNLTWKFVPTTADANYNTLTGTNGKLTGAEKADNTKTPDVTPVNATTEGGNGKLTISKKAADTEISDTAVVEYKLKTDTDWTKATFANGAVTVEVPIGEYEVRYAETDTVKAGQSVQATVSDLEANDNTPDVTGKAPTAVGGKGTLIISKKADDTETSDTAPVQYRLKGTDTWTDIVLADGKAEAEVAPGTYEVRYAQTAGFAPSASVEFTVPQESTHKISVVTPAADAHGTFTYTVGDGSPVSTDTAKVVDGTQIKITASPEKGYTVNKVIVTKDGTDEQVKTTGSYVFTMPENDVTIEVTFKKKSSGGGGGPSTYKVTYDAGKNGKITSGKASESVVSAAKPKAVPTVTANEGYKFAGWTQDGKTTVDPTTVKITKATTFTAVYEETAAVTPAPTQAPQADTDSHKEYIYGYEDGTFLPEAGITRAETAAIFARALTDFAEGGEYANTLSDIEGTEWFADNVNYLVSMGIITGYEDGTFRPYDNITRQEFATMISSLGEVMEAGDMPFGDVSEANWGIDYIYTAYTNGWVSGYEDGTFRPENQITRAEAVKIVNGYLGRGTDEAGIAGTEYTSFPDVETSHWAYYDIIEAANEHTFTKNTMPEKWVD